jgi:GDP-4-dehydro-6-deoxy-D-mannose reductase
MKTVLVTGATGALGRAVIAHLKSESHCRVVAISRHCDAEDGFQFDIRDREQLADAIKRTRPDLVIHLAATFTNDFDEAYAVNVEASRCLLEIVQESGLRIRVLLVGSAAEYGVVQPEENPVSEDHALNPVSVYGLTKAWQTQLAMLYASRGMDVVVARVFNLDGPDLSERLFVGRLRKQIEEVLAGQKSVISLGPLSAIRDYISTDEAARQMLAIAERAESGRVYHVASGIPVVMRDMLDRCLALYGLDKSIVREANELSNRTGYDVPAIYADVSRTEELLEDWRASVKF